MNPVFTHPILLIRGTGNDRDAKALESLGIPTLIDSFTEITPGNLQAAQELLDLAQNNDCWIIITSLNAIDFWSSLVDPQSLRQIFSSHPLIKFAAIGTGSADALKALGVNEILTPEVQSSTELLKLLAKSPVSRAIIPAGNLAMQVLPQGLKAMGWDVITRVVYINTIVATIPKSIQALNRGEIAAVLLRSPSAARALAHFAPRSQTPIICGGQTTAKAAKEFGFKVLAVAEDPSPTAVADLILQTLEE